MFAHRFRRILLSQDEFKISSTLLELFAHRPLVFFKSLQSLEIGLHLVTWDRDLATKDTGHPHLPFHVPIAMKISTVIPFITRRHFALSGKTKSSRRIVMAFTGMTAY